MTTDPDSGVKLRTLWMVVVLVFAVTVTGGYVTTAVLTDSESVGLSFHIVGNQSGNTGNTGTTANTSTSTPTNTPTNNTSAHADEYIHQHADEHAPRGQDELLRAW